jgi:DNA-binding response OmpR family regulator
MEKKILIIERNDDIREIYEDYFSKKYAVKSISSGDLLNNFSINDFELLIWDYHKYDKLGLSIALEFISNDRPVIISTTGYMEMRLDFRLHALPRIIKPYTLEELDFAINLALILSK